MTVANDRKVLRVGKAIISYSTYQQNCYYLFSSIPSNQKVTWYWNIILDKLTKLPSTWTIRSLKDAAAAVTIKTVIKRFRNVHIPTYDKTMYTEYRPNIAHSNIINVTEFTLWCDKKRKT